MNEAVTRACALSNGDYAVLVTDTGGGFSALNGFALTRWQPDPAAIGEGLRIYMRDLDSGVFWSLSDAQECGIRVLGDRIEQWSSQSGIAVHSSLRIAHDRNVEQRVIRVTNHSDHARRLDLT